MTGTAFYAKNCLDELERRAKAIDDALIVMQQVMKLLTKHLTALVKEAAK